MQNGIQGVILACILTLSLAACGQEQFEPPPPTVGIVTLATGSTELANELPGRIAARETAGVRPQISGVIRRRLFEEGSLFLYPVNVLESQGCFFLWHDHAQNSQEP